MTLTFVAPLSDGCFWFFYWEDFIPDWETDSENVTSSFEVWGITWKGSVLRGAWGINFCRTLGQNFHYWHFSLSSVGLDDTNTGNRLTVSTCFSDPSTQWAQLQAVRVETDTVHLVGFRIMMETDLWAFLQGWGGKTHPKSRQYQSMGGAPRLINKEEAFWRPSFIVIWFLTVDVTGSSLKSPLSWFALHYGCCSWTVS